MKKKKKSQFRVPENEPYSLAFVETLTARNRGERSKKDDRKEKKEMGEPGERVVFVGGKTWYDDKSKTNDDDGMNKLQEIMSHCKSWTQPVGWYFDNRNLRVEYVVNDDLNDDTILHGIRANRLSIDWAFDGEYRKNVSLAERVVCT